MLDDAGTPNEAAYPLSFAQERMWLMELLSGREVLYGTPIVLRLVGDLHIGHLVRALEEIFRRHEVLRTRIREENGVPVGSLGPVTPLALPEHDLRELSAQEVDEWIASAVRASFDLAEGPLVRLHLLRDGDRTHLLVLDFHHIVFDGLSFGPLIDELAELYEARVNGRPARLPVLRTRFSDHARREREHFNEGRFNEDLSYWTEQLTGAPAVLELPTELPREESRQPGENYRFAMPTWTRDGIAALSQDRQATPFMVMLAAWAVLLSRYTRQDDFVVGTPVSGRIEPELDDLIGSFVNTIALRLRVEPSATFADLVAQCRETTLEGLMHQAVPVDRVVEALGLHREPGRNPLFQTLFSFDEDAGTGREFGGVSLRHHAEPQSGTSKFDISLHVTDRQGQYHAEFEYRSDVLGAEAVRRLAGQWLRLLGEAVTEPDHRVGSMSILTARERKAIVSSGYGGIPHSVDEAAQLHELFRARATAAPDSPAVTEVGESTTYGEIEEAAGRLAAELKARGVAPGDPVALAMPRGWRFVVAMVAVLKTGGFFVPLDVNSPPQRNQLIVDDVGATVVLTDAAWVPNVPDGPEPIVLDDPEVVAVVSGRAPAGGLSGDPGRPAYAIYTSGSTGVPKGVLVTHANVVRLFRVTEDKFEFGTADVWTWFHSPAFDVSVWELWGPLLHGGRIVVVPSETARSPRDLLEVLRSEKVTFLSQTPSAFYGLSKEATDGPVTADELSLRFIIFAGEALDVTRLRPWVKRFGDCKPALVNMYGPTETTVYGTFRRLVAEDVDRVASPIGDPLGDLSLHLLDDFLEPVPAGVPGEIWVGGAGVALGYLNRPALTAERFVPDPYSPVPGGRLYRSGDIARRTGDGDILYVGRSDDQIQIRGHRVEVGEVEVALRKHPRVEDACVLAEQGQNGETALIGYLVEEHVDRTALRAHLARLLPTYMIPGSFVRVDHIPQTLNGKVDRRKLASTASAAPLPSGGNASPRTQLECDLHAVWMKLLGRSDFGVEEDFFAVGGNSLAVLRLATEASAALGTRVDPAAIFRAPTIRAMAVELAANVSKPGPLFRLRPGGGPASLVLVHSVGGSLSAYTDLIPALDGPFQLFGLSAADQGIEEIGSLAQVHADALDTVTTDVVLVGWSMGALIAYEVAQHLAERGRVGVLVIALDAPASLEGTLVADNESITYRFFDDLTAGLGHRLTLTPPQVDSAFTAAGLSGVLAEAGLTGRLGLSGDELETLYSRFDHNFGAADRHRPTRRHAVRVTLVRAKDQPHSDPREDLGWAALTGESVPALVVPGDHYTSLRPPHVTDLAAAVLQAAEITTAPRSTADR